MNIKNKIKFYRTKRKLTQKELAEIVNISESHLQNIEYGSAKPNVELALKIADSLNVTVEELFRPPRKNSSSTLQKRVQFPDDQSDKLHSSSNTTEIDSL